MNKKPANPMPEWSRAKKDARNAKNRVARKARRRNR